MGNKVALHNLGCKVNAYEIEAMQQLLEEAGYEIVPFEPGADIYVINTCTVTNIADRKSRQMLHKAKKMNPEAIVVATGSRDNNKVAVVAVGSSVLFIEFGTGVKYPDNHPEAGKNGFTRGGYGYKLGRLEKGWRYTGDPGSNGEVITTGKHAGEVHTHGNPANMSMYETVRELEEKFAEIARRCYT